MSLLHGVTSRLAVNVWNKHSIHTPEMNSGWLLWRIVKGLGGNGESFFFCIARSNIEETWNWHHKLRYINW